MKSNKTARCEFLYGIHPIHEMLIANKRIIHHIYIKKKVSNPQIEKIVKIAKHQNIDISFVSSEVIHQRLGHEDHQQIAARVSALPLVDMNQLLANPNPCLIICDHIIDPHNMGAIIRTALATGVNGIITTKDHASPLSPTVSKTSAGALEHMPIARVTNLVRCLKQIKQKGIWVFGLDAVAQQNIYDIHFDLSVALVIGGEHKGIRRLVQETCDQIIGIPQVGPLDSLNASVAAAVAMYEIFRQRQMGMGS